MKAEIHIFIEMLLNYLCTPDDLKLMIIKRLLLLLVLPAAVSDILTVGDFIITLKV